MIVDIQKYSKKCTHSTSKRPFRINYDILNNAERLPKRVIGGSCIFSGPRAQRALTTSGNAGIRGHHQALIYNGLISGSLSQSSHLTALSVIIVCMVLSAQGPVPLSVITYASY